VVIKSSKATRFAPATLRLTGRAAAQQKDGLQCDRTGATQITGVLVAPVVTSRSPLNIGL